MQAHPFNNIIVPKPQFPSLINLPAVHRPPPSTPLLKPPHAISISTSNERTTPTPASTLVDSVDDDAVAAFWDYQFLFVSQRSETNEPVTLRVVEGAVPPEFPSGTYYLTGPGIFSDDHGSTVHPLDGHGYLRAFKFDGADDVKFMAKYVKTEAQVEEHDPVTDTWRFTHRGPFSVLKGGRRVGNTKVMKNVANTSVLSWGGKLMCLWEGGDPYEIEPETLDTVGKVKLMEFCDDQAVESGSGGGGGGGDGSVWDVAARLLKPILHEFDSNFKEMGRQLEFIIPDHLMIHDWAFTDTHYILFANRIKLDVVGALTAVCGTTPMITALSGNPSKDTSPIYLLPRFGCEVNHSRDWRVPIEAPSQFWMIHVCNAYEDLDDNGNLEIRIHGSACSYEWFNFQKLFGYDWQSGKLDPSIMNINGNQSTSTLPHLVQVSINLDANGICKRCDAEPLKELNKSSDFPVINPAFSGSKNKYIYAAASSGSRTALPSFPFDMVVKYNGTTKSVHTWSVGSRRFIGEPTFIAKSSNSEEDEGYILVVEYAVAVQRCYLVILDSKKIGADDAFVARLEVPKHLNFPLGFHGLWARD